VATEIEPADKATAVDDGNVALLHDSGRAHLAPDSADHAARSPQYASGNPKQASRSALSQANHEQVVFCHDAPTGLRAIIAIYSTVLGPALGGTRFYPYASHEEAISDALNLSRAMTYKNALAGLDFGGGKAVIIGDPARI